MLRLGCDIGGTFTDFTLLDDATGQIETLKLLTTPDDPSRAVGEGISELAGRYSTLREDLSSVIHGTTLLINAVIERKGAKTALITTDGFRDILELRREIRYDIYDIRQRYPKPLIERRNRFELPERIMADGRVRKALDETAARALIEQISRSGFEAVAVCFLHAYANPDHERRLRAIAADVAQNLDVSLSSDVLPEVQEFERTATTAINAYVRPLMRRYLARLEERLSEAGFGAGLFLMLSGGGIIAASEAANVPVRLAESGPVGGAIAARALGKAAKRDTLLAFDMGGTTAKACLIEQGRLPVTSDYEVDRVHRFKRGSGTPIAVPTVDLIEIGAGGGSLASIDPLGRIAIGPASAGADPGPACYGRGGAQATVTDADFLLGYLDPTRFVAGRVELDREAAEAAIMRDIGEPLGLEPLRAAAAIVEVVDENMAQAARMYVAEHGGDLDKATMVAFGGAGPLHADRVARKLGVRRLIIPPAAGVFSALGFLAAPLAFETSRTRVMRLSETKAEELRALFAELEGEAEAVVKAAADAPVKFGRVLDMAYVGQGHTLRVPIAELVPDAIAATFAAAYARAYGYAYDDLEAQIVTLRVTATSDQPTAPISQVRAKAGAGMATDGDTRLAYCPKAGAMIEHRVLDFDDLDGNICGPAILEQAGSTIRIGVDAAIERDPRGWVEIKLETLA